MLDVIGNVGTSQVLSLLRNLVELSDVPSTALKFIVPKPTAPVAAVLLVPVM